MPTFKLDGVDIPFEAGDTIITAAHKQGIEIPHYCWHPGLSAPANCRMCLVEQLPKPGTRAMMLDLLELDAATGEYKPAQKPKLVPACQQAAAEGTEILADKSDHVLRTRKAVQELLLLNHPVDCPICDQAGECKLQDYWLEHGQGKKRMRDEPVHKPKAVSFGPTIVYDAERCVMCTRCIRFMAEVAKDPVLSMRERGNHNEIVLAQGRELDGKYSLMTEYVCPVGALTAKDFRFKARVWFLRGAKSVCQGCATGCNTRVDFDPRHNKVHRLQPRENAAVNGHWMCDDGMLSYARAHERRITEAEINGHEVSVKEALSHAVKTLASAGPGTVAVLLSAQHSLEDNWALHELGCNLLGAKEVYFTGKGVGYEDDILIHKDKNPNTAGVLALAPHAKAMSQLEKDVSSGKVTVILALGGEISEAALKLKPAAVVVAAAHGGAVSDQATVVLPATSWAEQSGSYINAKGIRQLAERAIDPLGASRPAWMHFAAIAEGLGNAVPWGKLKAVREKLPEPAAAQLP